MVIPHRMKSVVAQLDSKTRILNATMRVIRERGYTATTIDDVCEAAGLTKGSFFHHFKSKEELAVAAADHFGAVTTEFFKSAPYHRAEDPLDRVLGYIEFREAILKGEIPDYTCLLGMMVQETYDTHPAIRKACEKHISRHAATVAEDIAEAKRKHAPNAVWTPESIAMYTQAVLQGAFILAKAKQSSKVASECIVHLRRSIELMFRNPE